MLGEVQFLQRNTRDLDKQTWELPFSIAAMVSHIVSNSVEPNSRLLSITDGKTKVKYVMGSPCSLLKMNHIWGKQKFKS